MRNVLLVKNRRTIHFAMAIHRSLDHFLSAVLVHLDGDSIATGANQLMLIGGGERFAGLVCLLVCACSGQGLMISMRYSARFYSTRDACAEYAGNQGKTEVFAVRTLSMKKVF